MPTYDIYYFEQRQSEILIEQVRREYGWYYALLYAYLTVKYPVLIYDDTYSDLVVADLVSLS